MEVPLQVFFVFWLVVTGFCLFSIGLSLERLANRFAPNEPTPKDTSQENDRG